MLNLDRIEKELDIKLPSFFKKFHLEKAELINKFHNISNDFNYIVISSDTDWIIQYNRDFLKLPRSHGICRNKLCIGTDGCGNNSFISIIGDDQRVFFIDHEYAEQLMNQTINDFEWENEELEKYKSLEEYLKFYLEIYEG